MKIYYIGDLCRLFANNEWKFFLEETGMIHSLESGSGEYKGFTFHQGGTAYGDGTYLDNFSRKYLVDSGSIGIVSADFPETFDSWKTGGQTVELEDDFEINIAGGRFKFGSVIIDPENNDWDDEED